MAPDPAAIDEVRHHGPVDATRRAQVEIFDAGGLTEGGKLQPGEKPLGITLGGFMVDQEAEPLLEAQRLEGGRGQTLVVERLEACL